MSRVARGFGILNPILFEFEHMDNEYVFALLPMPPCLFPKLIDPFT